VIGRALAEDVGSGDVTTDAIVPADLRGSADVVVREAGVICGLDQAFAVLLELDPTARIELLAQDGDRIEHPPRVVARLHASVRALLTGERTALNLLQRMSGAPADELAARRALVDPLTGREQTILRYLASTLSTSEIAGELYVTVNTVKTHQRTVYRKLGAGSRRDAVRRARALRLL